jgi:hypothetical protein
MIYSWIIIHNHATLFSFSGDYVLSRLNFPTLLLPVCLTTRKTKLFSACPNSQMQIKMF